MELCKCEVILLILLSSSTFNCRQLYSQGSVTDTLCAINVGARVHTPPICRHTHKHTQTVTLLFPIYISYYCSPMLTKLKMKNKYINTYTPGLETLQWSYLLSCMHVQVWVCVCACVFMHVRETKKESMNVR